MINYYHSTTALRVPRVLGLFATLSLAVALTSCGNTPANTQHDSDTSTDASGSSSQERLASSMNDYIDQIIKQAKQNGQDSDQQMALLEQIKQDHQVSASVYEQAWSNYKQCMVDKGQPEPVLLHYSNGMYAQASLGGSDKRISEFSQAMTTCQYQEVMDVNTLYGAQQGNPDLLKDSSEAIVDCLHRQNLVPKSYTADDFNQEWNSSDGKTTFDITNAEALSCLAANGAVYTDVTRDKTQELGQ